MKDAYYFPHDSNAKDDPKCIMLIEELGLEGYGIFWMLLETLRDQPGYRAPVNMIPGLARRYNSTPEKVKAVVMRYQLFEVDEDEFFFSLSFQRRMEVIDGKREKARNNALSKWGSSNNSNAIKRSERLQKAREKGRHKKADWEEMKVFFEDTCLRCGSANNLVKDHIIPIYQGGSDGIDNIQPLCASCNSSKGPENYDYRLDWCHNNNKDIPKKWLPNACGTPAEALQVKERKGKESKKTYSEFVERLYQAYPRKVAPKKAKEKIEIALRDNDYEYLKEKVELYAKSINGTDKQFVPHPATWFHQERFNDDPKEWVSDKKETKTQIQSRYEYFQ